MIANVHTPDAYPAGWGGNNMNINIIEAFATANKCYQAAIPLYPQGIMLHSIGVPDADPAGWEAIA